MKKQFSAAALLAASCLSFTLYVLPADGWSAPKRPNTTASSASSKRPDTGAARNLKPRHNAMTKARNQLRSLKNQLKEVDAELASARRAEARIRRQHEGSDSSRLRQNVRQATLRRANLELRRDDLAGQVRRSQTAYINARRALSIGRGETWKVAADRVNSARSNQGGQVPTKITIANRPLGPTGSGATRPKVGTQGILKKSQRYEQALDAKRK